MPEGHEKFNYSEYLKNHKIYKKREKIENQIKDFLNNTDQNVSGFAVVGQTGIGKTNLLCRLFTDLKNIKDKLVFYLSDWDFAQLEKGGGYDLLNKFAKQLDEIIWV